MRIIGHGGLETRNNHWRESDRRPRKAVLTNAESVLTDTTCLANMNILHEQGSGCKHMVETFAHCYAMSMVAARELMKTRLILDPLLE